MKISLVILCCCCSLLLTAQTPEDSTIHLQDTVVVRLEKQLKSATSDSVRVRKLNALGLRLLNKDLYKANYYMEQALQIVNSSNQPVDELLQKMTYSNTGRVKQKQGDQVNALAYYLKALEIAEKKNDSLGMASLCGNISLVYRYEDNFEKSIEYTKRSIGIKKQLVNSPGIAGSYNNLGAAYRGKGALDSALYYFEKAKIEYTSVGKELGVIRTKANIATIYELQEKYEESLKIFSDNLHYYKESRNNIGISNTHGHLSRVYGRRGNYQKAIQHADSCIMMALRLGRKIVVADVYKYQSDFYREIGDFEEAYKALDLHHSYNDSLVNVENIKRIQELELRYQFRKEKLSDSLQLVKQREMAETSTQLLAAKNRLKSQWLIFGGLGALGLLGFVFFRSRQKLKMMGLKNQLLNTEIEYKKKDLANLAINISQSQNWAGSLLEQLEKARAVTGRERSKELQNLEVEIKNKMRIDGEAEDIQLKIDTLSSAFYEKLNDNFPDLTTNEVRLCSLIRMDMGTKDIAILQNIDPLSVKKGRSRLRKKLNLLPNDDIHMFLKTI